MITIDMAFDKDLASELTTFLTNLGIDAHQKDSDVLVNQDNIDKDILESFLKDKKGYVIKKINPESLLISKMANVEDFGLASCEICGYIAFEEELLAHRRTHGI